MAPDETRTTRHKDPHVDRSVLDPLRATAVPQFRHPNTLVATFAVPWRIDALSVGLDDKPLQFSFGNADNLSMNIVVASRWYPTTNLPANCAFVREHAKAVATRHEVTVLHLAGSRTRLGAPWRIEAETDPAVHQGIPTYRVWHSRALRRLLPFLPVLAALAALRQLRRAGIRPDVLHAHTYLAGLPMALLGHLTRTPVVVTEHLSAFPYRRLDPLHRSMARWTFRLADTVVPVSTFLQRRLTADGFAGRFRPVPNPIDTEVFHPDPSPRESPVTQLLCVGRLHPDKDLSTLLQALTKLPTSAEWHLRVAGDGPDRNEYERLADTLGIGGRVTFLGAVPRSRVAELLRSADLLVHPSPVETFSLAVAEALCSGTPIAATDTGAIRELVEATDGGIVVSPGDPKGLARAIESVRRAPHRFDRARIAARASERLSFTAVAGQLDEIYGDLSPDRSRGTFARSWRRARLWTRMLGQLRGRSVRDQIVLVTSAAADTLRTLAGRGADAPLMLWRATARDIMTKLEIELRRGTDDAYLALPGREEDVEATVLDALRPGDCFVDCGANIGFYTLRAAQRVGSGGTVVAIEPHPETFTALSSHAAHNKLSNIRRVRAALGARSGLSVPLSSPKGVLGQTTTAPATVSGFGNAGEAPGRTLDDVCASHSSIRVLKIDVEGAEADVLRGAPSTLAKTDMVIIEVNGDAEEVERILREAGFDVTPLRFTHHLVARRRDAS